MELSDILNDKIEKVETMVEKRDITADEGMKLKDEDLEMIAGGIGSQIEEKGFKCPQCGLFVSVSMHQIMTSSSLFCYHCGLRMDIPRDDSVLSRLQRLEI